jgi:sulfide:quinone oxidoreductase
MSKNEQLSTEAITMDVRRLTDELAVAPQISVADVAELKAAGFCSVICNRPDGESMEQVAFAEIETAAKAAGLEIVWQPIMQGGLSDESAEQFGEIVDGLPKPVLAYCKSGTRCAALWSLSEAKERPLEDIIKRTAEAGYDFRGLMPRLEAIKGSAA